MTKNLTQTLPSKFKIGDKVQSQGYYSDFDKTPKVWTGVVVSAKDINNVSVKTDQGPTLSFTDYGLILKKMG